VRNEQSKDPIKNHLNPVPEREERTVEGPNYITSIRFLSVRNERSKDPIKNHLNPLPEREERTVEGPN